jgi:prolyl-tRNA synthetase
MEKNKKKQSLAISFDKETDFSKWYIEVIQKADLVDYSQVSGCIVYKPNLYQIWEKIQEEFNLMIKKSGVKNSLFPLFIPEKLLLKEEEHVEGFAPEVLWINEAGGKGNKLKEKLAIRPTSETIMYDSYSKWIKSYRDLPLRLNQWNCVYRWEKNTTPLIRGMEILWQEGHSVFETQKEATTEVFEILNYYRIIGEEFLAIPLTLGLKSINEKFAGSEFSSTIESFMPDNRVLQSGTSHHLGQNFAKAFDIQFEKENKKNYPFQNSWGISMRLLGAMIMLHSDNRGFICPPKVAINKIVIVPLLFKGKEEKVLKKAEEIKNTLKIFNPILDDNSKESAGFKFGKWEIQGIPLRIELGPRDLENEEIIIVRRDTQEKTQIKLKDLNEKLINDLLEEIQNNLFRKAKNFKEENTVYCENLEEFVKELKNDKRVLVAWFEDKKSEEEIKEKYGVKTSCIPIKFNKEIFEKWDLPKEISKYESRDLENKKCFFSGKKANCFVYFSNSY